MAAWIKPKMAHKQMVNKLLQVRAHIILCFRAEPKIEMVKDGNGKMQIVEKKGLRQVTDTGAIEGAIDAVIAANGDKVAEFRGGKDTLFGFFVGQAMKATRGKANPQQLNEVLRRKLQA